jgi:Tol biopolymer transport system component
VETTVPLPDGHGKSTDYDNLPDWSPDGEPIVFTRRHGGFNFDIFTIRVVESICTCETAS